jgi:hypothetical protein
MAWGLEPLEQAQRERSEEGRRNQDGKIASLP